VVVVGGGAVVVGGGGAVVVGGGGAVVVGGGGAVVVGGGGAIGGGGGGAIGGGGGGAFAIAIATLVETNAVIVVETITARKAFDFTRAPLRNQLNWPLACYSIVLTLISKIKVNRAKNQTIRELYRLGKE